MKYSQARPGRVFVIRLEDGDIVHECVEAFARSKKIKAASVIALGGADAGSTLVVGPKSARAKPIVPMELVVRNVHEVAGIGTIFPDQKGHPVLHMHMACGRKAKALAGCVRKGVKTWHVMEIILWELVSTTARRVKDPATGFELLAP